MMITGNTFLPIFLGLLCLGTTGYSSGSVNDSNVGCLEIERQALVMFKQGLTSRSGRLSSWVSEQDCCKWRGVGCNYTTGHVITLDLHSPHPTEPLQGELSSHLLDLPYLNHLDLSLNDFGHVQIPEFIGSLSNLKYLNLSNANFRGTIPNHLGNLSHLESLDLSGNGYSLRANNLVWLYGLSSLKVLNMNGVDVSNSVNWLGAVNMLPSLVELHLVFCKLTNLPSSLPYVNFTSLQVLDLSFNYFSRSAIPQWLFDISPSLVHLKFRRCHLKGPIPNAFGDMTSLVVLDLSENDLTGVIPTTLGIIWEHNQLRTHSSLRELRLSSNKLNGSLERVLAQFSELVILDVGSNFFKGKITEAHLLNSTRLRTLNLSGNSLIFNVSSSWIPVFQLDIIDLQSCQLGTKFPNWLQTQNNFSSIDISRAGISDTVPDWFWNLSRWVKYMDLSRNQLTGKVPDFTSKLSLSIIDLSVNNFSGPLPRFPPSVESLVLAKNSFSGNLSSLCELIHVNNSLDYLDLSSNLFSGSLPDCWTYGEKLVVLDLANNSLSGNIPDSIGHLVSLKTLRLRQNSISGHLPLALKNCTSLFILSLGKNKLSGKIPAWIGESSPDLIFLILDHNEFEGNIPLQLCRLKYMQILNLAFNKLSGGIPRCVSNFLVMAEMEDARSSFYTTHVSYMKDEVLTVKQRDYIYSGRLLPRIQLVDLSSNALSGGIPGELMSLTGLLILNLSMNYLTGPIPSNINSLKSLNSIDLSRNHLSCTIPTGLSELIFLCFLNLSYNNLSGKIPSGNQLDTFFRDSYIGNPYLCGTPLSNNCSVEVSNEIPYCSNKDGPDTEEATQEHSEEDWLGIPPFYVSMGLGFITGLWGFLAALIISPSWRNAYYRFLNDLNDKIYVLVVVNVAKWRRMFQRE